LSRGSSPFGSACLDVLRVKKLLTDTEIAEGKALLIEVVSMTAGLIARFSASTREEQAEYPVNTVIEEKEKE